MQRMNKAAGLAAVLMLAAATTAQASVLYSQGFETDNAGWNIFGGSNDATRVASGTNGVTSQSGGFHAQAAGPFTIEIAPGDGSAFTRWGAYRSTFPVGGYTTSLGIYLDLGAVTSNDTRFDWISAINDSGGTHRRDFVFNGGFYNDTDGTGSGARFVISAGNNTGRGSSFPKNPGHDPFSITATGWYTFVDRFYDNGGVLAVDLDIFDSSNTLLHSWTLSNATDLISGIGGNRYGWMADNELPFLAIDNAELRTNVATPEPATLAVLGSALIGFCMTRRRRH